MPLDFREVARAAKMRHSPFEWLRGPASYNSASDEVSLASDKSERYFPSDEDAILPDLAAISAPADAVAFVQRYGLLTKGPDDEDVHEPFSEIRDEAEMLWLYLRLYEVICRADRGDDNAVRELRQLWYRRLDEAAQRLKATSRPPEDDEELVGWCRDFLGWMTNEGMRGTEWVVVSEAAGWSLSGWPDDLLSHAYQQLAFLMVKKRPVRVCEECGLIFVVEHGRQRFCNPVCSGRARNRRWREAAGGKVGEEEHNE